MTSNGWNVLGGARDQGRRPTCVAFAVTAAHEHRRHVVEDDGTRLSEEYVCWAVSDTFARVPPLRLDDTARVMASHGQPPGDDWPYHPDVPPPDPPPQVVIDLATGRRATMRPIGANRTDVEEAVENGAAVVAVIRLWDGFFRGDGAVLYTPSPDELLEEDVLHAVALLPGVDNQLTLRNSWGPDWCDDGHVQVAPELVDVVVTGAFVIELVESDSWLNEDAC